MIARALEAIIGRELAGSPAPTEVLWVRARDGWSLPLRRYAPSSSRPARPLVLAPGLGGNHAAFDLDPTRSLAHVLVARGYDVFIPAFRGAEATEPPPRGAAATRWDIRLRAMIADDAEAIVDGVLAATGASEVGWVGHSLGALIGLQLAAGPRASALSGLVAIGAPLDLGAPALRRWLTIAIRIAQATTGGDRVPLRRLARLEAPLMGRLSIPHELAFVSPPGIDPDLTRRLHAHGVEDIPGSLLRDLSCLGDDPGWSESALAKLRLPVTFIAGERDPWAPPALTAGALRRAGLSESDLVAVGPSNGHRGDYAHVALIAGSHAPAEVFPLVLRALERS